MNILIIILILALLIAFLIIRFLYFENRYLESELIEYDSKLLKLEKDLQFQESLAKTFEAGYTNLKKKENEKK